MLKAPIRITARLDIKSPNLIKGVHLEGLRVLGDPAEFAYKYYIEGADEIIYMDAVASLYERNTIIEIISHTAEKIFVPLIVGGGIRSLHDVETVLRAGADKIAINTRAISKPGLIDEIVKRFGSQCVVLSVEAKNISENRWEAYINGGREKSGRDVLTWCKEAEDRGVGEVLLTSVDQEGTGKGFDVALTRAVSTTLKIPVIASGGCGKIEDIFAVVKEGRADAVTLAKVLHYNALSIQDIKLALRQSGVVIRP